MCAVNVAVGEDDVVDTLVYRLFCLLAEGCQCLMQSACALVDVEDHWELDCVESLVADVA